MVEWDLPNLHPPRTSEWDLIWSKGLCRCNYSKNLDMRSFWIRVTLNPMTSVPVRDRKGEEAVRRGGRPCDDGGRDWSGVSRVREAGNPPPREAWEGVSLRVFTESILPTPESQTSGLQNCEQIHLHCFKPSSFVVMCYGSLRKRIAFLPLQPSYDSRGRVLA